MNATQSTPDISPAVAAEILKVTSATIRSWMRSGKLKAVQIGGRFRTSREWIQQAIKPVSESAGVNGNATQIKRHIRQFAKSRFGVEVLGSEMHRDV